MPILRRVTLNERMWVTFRERRSPGGTLTNYESDFKFSIAVTANGDIYIGDRYGHRILKSSGGTTTTVAGDGTFGSSGDNGPAPSAQLGYPSAVALGPGGDVYFVDEYVQTLRRVSGGVITTLAGIPNTRGASCADGPATSTALRQPTGLAVDADGNAYISDSLNNCVRKVSGGTSTAIAGTGSRGFSGDGGTAVGASLSYPGAIAADAAGNLYLADVGNFRVRKISEGTINTIAGGGGWGDDGPAAKGQLLRPSSVALGPAGEVYIADQPHWEIRKVANGVITAFAGTGLSGLAAPSYTSDDFMPGGVAVGPDGAVYYTDLILDYIHKLSNGVDTILANGPLLPLWSPPVTRGWLYPASLAVDSAGSVYVADAYKAMIGKISNNVIYEFAGAVPSSGSPQFGGDNGPATSAYLYGPMGVALAASGDVYIADTANSCVRKVSNGVITTVAGVGGTHTDGFSGDGGPATTARLFAPAGVAVDASGNLYIADTWNNRIRKVSNGTITTIAGGGTSLGDGGPATGAQLSAPTGITVGPDGQVYIADLQNNRIRVLIPSGGSDSGSGSGGSTSCSSVSLLPAQSDVGASGGALTLLVVPQDQTCTWSVSNLPSWITAAPTTGIGPGTVTLTVAANTGALRSGSGTVNGAAFMVNQSPPAASCSYVISPSTQSFPASGGLGTIAVTAGSGCVWTVGTPPPWVIWTGPTSGSGSGMVSFSVTANTGAVRSASLQIANLMANVDQNGAVEAFAGVMGHFAAGDGWETTFTLVNSGSLAAHARLDFFDEAGHALAPQSVRRPQTSGPQPAVTPSTVDNLLNPGSLLQVNAPAGTTTSQTGWARLLTDGIVSGFGIFRLPVTSGIQEAVVPIENRNSSSFILPFDNTGGYFYGVAISNLSITDEVINVIFRDAVSGNTVGTGQFPLAAGGHTQFLLSVQFPQTAGMTGTAEFLASGSNPGDISLLGLRFNSNAAFTSVPAFVHGTQTAGAPLANAGAMAHIAFGGDWSTLVTLVNTGSATAHARLSFFDDDGAALAPPLSLPLSPGNTTQSSATFDQTLAPGAMVLVECAAPSARDGQTGWAQLSTDGSIGGFAVFRYTTDSVSQEAAVPLSPLNAGGSLLVFDNTNGYGNGVALANNSAIATGIPVVIRDASTGSAVAADTINLPAWGHTSFLLKDRYPVTAGISGTIEFSDNPGQISVLGLRVNSNDAFTSIPPIGKQ